MPENPPSPVQPASPGAESVTIPDRATTWSLYSGALSEWTMMGIQGRLLMPVLTTGFGLRPDLVSWAMAVPRFFDVLLDPLIGHVSDRTQGRWGRRRPYVLAGSVFCALALVALWWVSPDWGQAGQSAWLVAVGTIFWVGFAVFSIPLYAMNFELTDDYQYRVKFTAIRSLFCSLPGIAVGWAYWLALRPAFGGEIHGIRWVGPGLALIVLVTGCAPALFYRERFRASPKSEPSSGFLAALAHAWHNKPFRLLIIMRLLVAVGWAMYSGLVFYVNAYYSCGGDKDLATKIAGITETTNAGLQLLLVPLAPLVSRHLDKRTLLFAGVAGHIALGALGPFIFTPGMPYLQILGALFWAPAAFLFGTFCGSAMPDLCDIDELEHGVRREGLFSAVLVVLNKLETTLCTLIVGYGLVLSHFSVHTSKQAPATLLSLRWWCFGPYLVTAVITLLVAFKYDVTARVMEGVREKLLLRRHRRIVP